MRRAAFQPSPRAPVFPGFGEAAGLEFPELSPSEEQDIVNRLVSGAFEDSASSASRVGYCANPVRSAAKAPFSKDHRRSERAFQQ